MNNWEHSGFAARGSALAISPDLDALLEADTRRRQARAESPAPSFLSSSSFVQQPQQNSSFQGLPAPPRSRKTYQTQQRPRTANPLSIVHTPPPAREQQEQPSIASTNTTFERDSGLDPFLNPTPNIIKPAPTPPIFPSPPPTAQVASSSSPALTMHNGSEEAGRSSAVPSGVGGSNASGGGGSRLTMVKGLPGSMFQRARGAFRNESSDSRVRKSDELVQQQQPLHAHHGRNSSSASSGADSDPLSFSNPTSVRSSLDDFTAARISVSSTRYASSDGQHGSDPSHNQPQQPHAVVPAFSSRSGADYRLLGSQPSIAAPAVLLESSPRAESFIDLVSPPAHKDRYQDLLIQATLPATTATALITPSSSSPVTFYRPLPSLRTANLSPISPPGSSSSTAGRSPIRPLPRIPDLMPRPSSAGPLSRQKDKDTKTDAQPMPPTTNHRTERERADLVRKTQKLTQVFGTTPAAQDIAQHVAQTQASSSLLAPSAIKRTHPSGAKSLFVRPPTPPDVNTSQDSGNSSTSKGQWPPPTDGTQYVSASGRRHSAPLTPEEFSFLSTDGLVPTDESAPGSATTMSFRVSAIEVGSAEGTVESSLDDSFRSSNGALHAHARLMRGGGRDSLHPADSPDSPHSFMDFGDGNDRSRSPSPPPSATSPASSEDATSMLSVDTGYQRKQRKLRKQPGPRGARPSSMRSFSSGNAPSISDSSSLLSALSPTTPYIATPTSALSTAEDERRKMRDKLAKLHRFLGSRVPPDLVLGLSPNSLAGLPPIAAIPEGGDDEGGEMDMETRRSTWRQRRRRSSSAALPGRWSDDHRGLAELDEREKALVVRRAQKMERMFGVAPPQGLYHSTRLGESPSSNGPPPSSFSPPPSSFSFRTPAQEIQAKAQARPVSPSSSPNSPRSSRNTNVNQSAYTKLGSGLRGRSASGGKRKSGRHYRPGTGDSEEALLGGGSTANVDYSPPYGQSSHTPAQGHKQTGMSDVYMYYRNSLNSLRDIIDRDDKQSLAQLHEYLTSEDPDGDDVDSPEPNVLAYATSKFGPSGSTHNPTTSPTEMSPPTSGAMFSPSTPRRHSLPARASMSSLASEYTIAPPAPDPQAFAQRRRRAAKLAAFFGTSYKELVGEVLESIATGLRDEQGAGRLNDDEMRDLLRNVETIRHRDMFT